MSDDFKILSTFLRYDPNSGNLYWKVSRQCVKEGDIAGTCYQNQYLRVTVNYKRYGNHRVAWLLTHGEWPKGRLDHIDRDPSNNRISNLRLATHEQNMQNRKVAKNSKSGTTGVAFDQRRNSWVAYIQVKGKTIHLGRSKDKNTVIALRKSAETKYFKEFSPQCAPSPNS